MATYPLKNISIGGDTYEIQAGKSYRVTIEASLSTPNNIASLSIKDILETYASSIQWNIVGIYDIGPGGQSYDPQQVMISDLIGMKYYHAEYMFDGGDGLRSGSFIDWVPNYQSASNVMFGIDELTEISGLVSVNIDNETNYVGNVRLSNFGGGGGGGASLTTLAILKNGSQVPFTNLGQSDTVELWNISVSPSQTLNNIDLTDIIKASPVVVKADTYYGYLSSYNTGAKELCLVYSNSTQIYELTISHQWNANWQVTSNKRIMTQ